MSATGSVNSRRHVQSSACESTHGSQSRALSKYVHVNACGERCSPVGLVLYVSSPGCPADDEDEDEVERTK